MRDRGPNAGGCSDQSIDEQQTEIAEPADLLALARSSERFGLIWSSVSTDLNVNLLLFARGEGVPEHINSEVDVLVVCIVGEGEVTIDGHQHSLSTGQSVIVGKGTARSVMVTGERFSYLTCHRRRGGLWPTVNDREKL